MQLLRGLDGCPSNLPSPHVTIGNYDGVHLGHQHILKKLVREARASNGASIVITFDPHPLRVLLPDSAQPLIMTPAQKLRAIADFGVDYILVIAFDAQLARWSPRQFVQQILVKSLAIKRLLVGSNFVFGYQQRGNLETLKLLGKEFGFSVEGIPQFTWRNTRVSSTLIRGFIREGKLADANRLLGKFFSLEGKIVAGTGRGRSHTVPTLNLNPENELIPKNGVYVTQTRLGDQRFASVTNIGHRPTFHESHLTIETHLIETELKKTPLAITLAFLHRLRDEKKFASASELKAQIGKDVRAAQKYFARLRRFTSWKA